MSKYGNAAVMATKLYREDLALTPNEAWEQAVLTVFPTSRSSQEKGCPRATYLGLCESGVVSGIPAGNYSRSEKNKGYALKALSILQQSPTLLEDKNRLWEIVMESEIKKANHQMDVVISMWNEGLFI